MTILVYDGTDDVTEHRQKRH